MKKRNEFLNFVCASFTAWLLAVCSFTALGDPVNVQPATPVRSDLTLLQCGNLIYGGNTVEQISFSQATAVGNTRLAHRGEIARRAHTVLRSDALEARLAHGGPGSDGVASGAALLRPP